MAKSMSTQGKLESFFETMSVSSPSNEKQENKEKKPS